MTAQDALEKLLRAYARYYDIERDHPAEPFAAEAVFHSHDEQYFLIRAARIAEAEAHEYVFFAVEERLSAKRLTELASAAWTEGLKRVTPHRDHRSSDVILIVLTDAAEPEALRTAKRLKQYRSYRWGFRGWSHFLLYTVEAPTGRGAWNRQGARLKKLIQGNLGTPGHPL